MERGSVQKAKIVIDLDDILTGGAIHYMLECDIRLNGNLHHHLLGMAGCEGPSKAASSFNWI